MATEVGGLLTIPEAAGRLRVGPHVVYDAIRDRRLTARRIGRRLFVTEGDILDYLDRCRTDSEPCRVAARSPEGRRPSVRVPKEYIRIGRA